MLRDSLLIPQLKIIEFELQAVMVSKSLERKWLLFLLFMMFYKVFELYPIVFFNYNIYALTLNHTHNSDMISSNRNNWRENVLPTRMCFVYRVVAYLWTISFSLGCTCYHANRKWTFGVSSYDEETRLYYLWVMNKYGAKESWIKRRSLRLIGTPLVVMDRIASLLQKFSLTGSWQDFFEQFVNFIYMIC